jgi:uncharacterized protein
VDARGDLVIAGVGADGEPVGSEIKLEASTASPAELAQRLSDSLGSSGVQALAIGHGKASRPAMLRLREALASLNAEAGVLLVNEAGLSSYANSELARAELASYSVPGREAISLGRRYQDPLLELLKVEPRHLGLGREQSIVSKAALRRVIHDTIEFCVAHVGCDLNHVSLNFLRHVPGLSFELARKLIARRAERPFGSREELRTENLLDDLTWVNSIGFLRVRDSSEPLDATALHPEQYDLARRVILQGGGSVEETLGHRDATRGLRRADSEVDEGTWRDLIREIGYPGRDPRPRQFLPRLLALDLETKSLQKDQVLEGVVSNVASFGAFVDVGLAITNASGPRLELSLKNVPSFRRQGGERPRRHERPAHDGGPPAERRGHGERRPRREREESWPDFQPVLRAARSRRDGMVTGRGGDERRKGGGREGGRGPGRAGGGRSRGSEHGREEYDSEAVRRASRPTGTYNPFASFFQGKQEERPELPSDESGAGAPPA